MAAIDTPLVDILSAPAPTNADVPGKDTLIARLDELLERYLHTLDAYQKQRELLAKQFSNGFLSLAQANFQNRSSTIQYGKDCYDERMQAIRKVNIIGATEDDVQFNIAAEQEKQKSKAVAHETELGKNDNAQPSTSGNTSALEDTTKNEKAESDNHAKEERNTDPIRWFGILVPQSLRSAQASFISSVEGPIPTLVNAARDLRSQEIEIGRVRKAIKKL